MCISVGMPIFSQKLHFNSMSHSWQKQFVLPLKGNTLYIIYYDIQYIVCCGFLRWQWQWPPWVWVRCPVMLLSRRDCAPSSVAAKQSAGGPRSYMHNILSVPISRVVVVVLFCVFFSSSYTYMVPRADDISYYYIVIIIVPIVM